MSNVSRAFLQPFAKKMQKKFSRAFFREPNGKKEGRKQAENMPTGSGITVGTAYPLNESSYEKAVLPNGRTAYSYIDKNKK